MSKYIKIETDLNKFRLRINEVSSTSSYDYIKSVISDLKEVLNSNKDYVCVCAPQIDEKIRLFIVKTAEAKVVGDSRYKVFLNPMIVSKKGLHLSREASLSIPDKEYIIPRSDEIHVAYQESDGRINSESFKGAYAEVIQQMIDMLDGITLADYGLEIIEGFDEATAKEKEEIIKMYLESLKKISTDIKDQIESDDGLKTINDSINFFTGMLNGDIKPIDKEGKVVEPEEKPEIKSVDEWKIAVENLKKSNKVDEKDLQQVEKLIDKKD